METRTHNDTIKSDSMQDGLLWLKCEAYDLPDNTAGMTGWHVCYPQYDLQKFEASVRAAIREHVNAVYAAETRPVAAVAASPDPLADHNALMAEMDRADSIM